jgi:hypothetical protein
MTLARIQGLLFILFGAVSTYDGWRISSTVRPSANFDAIGPDRYLLALSIVMMIIGTFLVVRPSTLKIAPGAIQIWSWPPPHYLSVLVMLVTFVALAPYLGFTAACLLFFLASYRLLGEWTWARVAVYSVLTTAFMYVVFIYLADMSLPKSPLGF